MGMEKSSGNEYIPVPVTNKTFKLPVGDLITEKRGVCQPFGTGPA